MMDYHDTPLERFMAPNHDLFKLSTVFSGIKCWIAGGSVASSLIGEYTKASDIDVFCASWIDFKNTIEQLKNHGFKVNENEFQHCLKNPSDVKFIEATPNTTSGCTKIVQVIKMVWYDNIQQVLASFDLSCVKMGITSGSRLIWDKMGREDLNEKKLVVSNTMFPVSMVRRLKKYVKRGFTMYDGTLKDMRDELTDGRIKSSRMFDEILNSTDSVWNNPEYREDYYRMTPESFSRKWKQSI